MNFKPIAEILKYFDFFGTTFNFYTERNRKFYTLFGGILSLISFACAIFIFIYINLDDFLHNNPNSTTSTKRENYRKIKFKEEKIWIPWRIRDFGGKTIKHKDILYPIIFYYKGILNNASKRLDVTYELLNYTLCNETSMINHSNIYMIDIELDQLYCIDMEELDIGGSWDSDFLDLVTFDLYACKNGINYDEKNPNCTTYERISKEAGDNDCFEFEMYYPVVQYQPMNKTTPIFVRYYNYFYHLSRYSNKIDRLYLQQYLLNDDKGWLSKDEKFYSHWGGVSLNGDSYATGEQKDLMNEGSTSRLYSFNIYLKSEVIHYNRSYKKISLILADGLPIISVVINFFRIIAKILKISSGNRKLTELLFENLKKKKIKIHNEQFNSLKYESKKINEKRKSKVNENNLSLNKNSNHNNNISGLKNNNDISSCDLNKKDSGKNILDKDNERKSIIKEKNLKNLSHSKNNVNIYKQESNKHFTNNWNIKDNNGAYDNLNININNHFNNKKIEDIFSIKSNEISSNLYLSDKNDKNRQFEKDKKRKISSLLDINHNSGYVKKPLFPFRYYLCSIFIKNIDISNHSIFFTNKFIAVYNFICQLFDISSYLILQKEFEIMKNTILLEKYRQILENRQKINVNDTYFNVNMKECLDSKKFTILGRIK